MIEFRLLGALHLTDAEGREVQSLLTRPRRLALLAYLAAATPRGFHRRDSLLALFWPELDQEHGRAALGQALHGGRGTRLPPGSSAARVLHLGRRRVRAVARDRARPVGPGGGAQRAAAARPARGRGRRRRRGGIGSARRPTGPARRRAAPPADWAARPAR